MNRFKPGDKVTILIAEQRRSSRRVDGKWIETSFDPARGDTAVVVRVVQTPKPRAVYFVELDAPNYGEMMVFANLMRKVEQVKA